MGLLILFAWLFSYMILIHFVEGGDVTWFSMLFLYLLGYFFGGFKGMAMAMIFSVIKFSTDRGFGYVDETHMTAEIIDYIFSYVLVAAGGFFAHPASPKERKAYLSKYHVGDMKENYYLIFGYVMGMIFRYVSSVVNFVMFYQRAELTFWENLREGLLYCFGYVGVEMILTLLLLMIPPVRKAAQFCKHIATRKYKMAPENI